MRRGNALGLAALLLLLTAVFFGSVMCPPAHERETLPSEADRWREQPAPGAGTAQEGLPSRTEAAESKPPEVNEVLVRVTDLEGAPVTGAEVYLNWADRPGAAAAAKGRSGSDGTCVFRNLPLARFRAHAAANGYFPSAEHKEVSLPTRARTEIVLPLERGGLITGFVFGLDGFEVPFAWIRLRDLDEGTAVLARADERGMFNSGPLRRGGWEVAWVEHERAEPDPRIMWTAAVTPGSHAEVIVTLDRTTRGAAKPERAVGIVPSGR